MLNLGEFRYNIHTTYMVVQTGIQNRKPGFDTQIEGFPASSYVPNKANLLNQKLSVFPVNVLCEIARFDHV
jgi:hypothetical protein